MENLWGDQKPLKITKNKINKDFPNLIKQSFSGITYGELRWKKIKERDMMTAASFASESGGGRDFADGKVKTR